MIEADRLGQLRTGAASGVAARHLARADARTLGVIGCGYQAETQVACIRAAVPTIERVVAYCRTPETLAAFCETIGAEPGESHRDAAARDVVVTITSSRDPVLRGEWLAPGTLVVAAGANVVNRRELDNAVLERATVRVLRLARAGEARVGRPRRARRTPASSTGSRCTSSTRSCRVRSPAVSRTTTSSSSSRTGWPRGTSRWAPRRCASRASEASERRSRRGSEAFAASSMSPPNASMISGRSSSRRCCSGVTRFWTYLSSRISFERSPRVVLADDVPRDVLFRGAPREEKREHVLEPGHETRLYPGV